MKRRRINTMILRAVRLHRAGQAAESLRTLQKAAAFAKRSAEQHADWGDQRAARTVALALRDDLGSESYLVSASRLAEETLAFAAEHCLEAADAHLIHARVLARAATPDAVRPWLDRAERLLDVVEIGHPRAASLAGWRAELAELRATLDSSATADGNPPGRP